MTIKKFPHLTLFLASFAILAGCHVTAQAADNITPHDQQPVQPVIVSSNPTGTCTNYAQMFVNWKTGATTACANGSYVTASGSGSMIYPDAGISVSSGTAWSSSIAAPSGALVGTTDTQTLTNKTVDGVTPIVFGYLDATSSIQQQINARLTGIGIQVAGSAVGTAQILNFGTNLNATVAGGIATITATGGGGGPAGGTFATAASNTSTLTVGTDCTTGTPCMARVGSLTLAQITASMTVTATTGTGTNDTFYIYFDTANGNALTIGDGGTVTLTTPGSGAGSGMVVAGSAITDFPAQSLPLFSGTITSDNFTTVVDRRAQYSVAPVIAQGTCAIITRTLSLTTIGFDNTCASGGSWNGGTVTTPVVVSTDGLGSHAPQLTLSSSSATGFSALSLTNDAGHQWQISEGGSTTGAPYQNSFYMYDQGNSNVFFAVDASSDRLTLTSTSASNTVAELKSPGNSASIALTDTASGGHSWLYGVDGPTSTPGTFWVYDATANSTEMRIDAVAHITRLNAMQLGSANTGAAKPTCDSTAAGTFYWDTTTTPKSPEVCDGSAWHHVTYSD